MGQRSIGIVEWMRNADYGVLTDCVTGAEVFFHSQQNPSITKVTKGAICTFEPMPDHKKNGLISIDRRSRDRMT